MSSPSCFGSRQLLRLRVALLDSTGAPDAGASNGFVTSNPVSIQMTPNVEAGDEFTLKNGGGDTCQSVRDCDKVKGNDLVVNLCELDAQLVGLMTGSTVMDDGTGAMGLMIPKLADACVAPVCVEWWTIAQDGASQGVISGSPLYWHFVVPKVTFVFGSHTFENGILTVSLNGKGEENPNITANGPFDDWPTALNDDIPDGAISAFTYWRETSLPTASCDYVEVTSAAS